MLPTVLGSVCLERVSEIGSREIKFALVLESRPNRNIASYSIRQLGGYVGLSVPLCHRVLHMLTHTLGPPSPTVKVIPLPTSSAANLLWFSLNFPTTFPLFRAGRSFPFSGLFPDFVFSYCFFFFIIIIINFSSYFRKPITSLFTHKYKTVCVIMS